MASRIVVNLDTSRELYLNSKCKQNDDLTLEASIFENGLAKDLSNCSIVIQALKADRTYIIQNTDITKENNKFIANLVRDFTRVAGKTEIEIVLTESSKQNTTFSFCIEVIGSVIKGAVQSSNTVTILEDLQGKIEEAGQVRDETEQLIQSGGAATKGDIQEVNSHLEQKANENEVVKKGYGTLNDFNEDTRAVILGMEEGQVNAVLGEGNVMLDNLNKEVKDAIHESSTSYTVNFDDCIIELNNANGALTNGANRKLGVPIGSTGAWSYLMMKYKIDSNYRGNKLSISMLVSVDDQFFSNVTRIVPQLNLIDSEGIETKVTVTVGDNGFSNKITDTLYEYGINFIVPSDCVEIRPYYQIQNSITPTSEVWSTLEKLILRNNNEANIRKIVKEESFKEIKKRNIINNSISEVTLTGLSNYLYLDVSLIKDITLKAKVLRGSNYLDVNFININTITSSKVIGTTGTYKINLNGATTLKLIPNASDNESNIIVNILENYTPIINDVLLPKSCNLIKKTSVILENTNSYLVRGRYNNKLYGTHQTNGYIKYSDNNGEDGFPNTIVQVPNCTEHVNACLVMNNGNIVTVANDGKVYLIKEGTSDLIEKFSMIASDGTSLAPNLMFSSSCYENIAILCEYKGSKIPPTGLKAYISEDYGETWRICFDLSNYSSSLQVNVYHLHCVKYDPYEKLLWATAGDGIKNQMIFYSDDMGENWYLACDFGKLSIQRTEIIPLKNCVLFLSDARLVSCIRYNRQEGGIEIGSYLNFDLAYVFAEQWGKSNASEVPIGCHSAIDYENSKAYFGYPKSGNSFEGHIGNELKYGNVFATDGYNFEEIFKKSTQTSVTTCILDGNNIIVRHGGTSYTILGKDVFNII